LVVGILFLEGAGGGWVAYRRLFGDVLRAIIDDPGIAVGLLWSSGGLGTVVDIPGMVGTAEDSPRMVG
jgi:hypothetical protein